MSISTRFSKGQKGSIQLHQTKVRLAEPEERERWNELIIEHHYIGNANLTGRQLRYVAECRGKCVALISFSAAALRLAGRDQWIGWNSAVRTQRLNFVVQNSRFLIMPYVQTKNLASRVMKLCRQRLQDDWMKAFQHPILLLETFVDQSYKATSYRADNWIRLGETKGFSRDSKGFYVENGSPKSLYVKELTKNGKEILASEKLPEDLIEYEIASPKEQIAKSLRSDTLGNLLQAMKEIKDERGRKGRRHNLASTLALIVCGTLAGAKGLSECAELILNLRQPQLRALQVWRNPITKKYKAPSHSALHRILSGVDPIEFENVFLKWFNSQADKLPDAIAIDGKALRASFDENYEGVHVVSAISHDKTPFLPKRQSKTKDTK
tara:strand:- start:71 stop:1213 length:1143 start_codon:yes stop_codon:yes gene_type:complete